MWLWAWDLDPKNIRRTLLGNNGPDVIDSQEDMDSSWKGQGAV